MLCRKFIRIVYSLDVLIDGARDELPVFIHTGVQEWAVALVGPLLDEAGRDDADDDGVDSGSVHEGPAVVVLNDEISNDSIVVK